jgi:flagellin
MSISSINTNLAALLAQQNIGTAQDSTSNAVAQLSSGNRLVTAATDVAALAVGTSLQAQVNVLSTVLTVAGQGTSLLQVANGGLTQIQGILQRQQAIATEAQAGSLSPTQLGFLNQEFQNLTQQINSLAGSTNFNGVNLINGAIAGNASVNSNTGNDNVAQDAQAKAFITLSTATPAGGDTLSINGVTVTFTTFAAGTSQAAGDVVVGQSQGETAVNLAAFLNSSGNPHFAGLAFLASSAAGTVTAEYTGGFLPNGLSALTVSASFATPANVSTSNITIAAAGTGINGLGVYSSQALGTVTGSLLVNSGLSNQSIGNPVDVTLLKNNASFIGNFGSIGTITAAYDFTAGTVTFSLTNGNFTYSTTATNLSSAGAVVPLQFNGFDNTIDAAGGGSFTLNLNGTAGSLLTLGSQTDANNVASQLNTALAGVSVYQNRNITSYVPGALVSVGGIQVGNLQGSQFTAHLNNFANANISSFNIAAPSQGSNDAVFTAVINGDTYTSYSGIGNQIGTTTAITLQDTSNPKNTVQLVLGNVGIASSATTALDLSTQQKATAIAQAIQQGLGITSAGAALTFQVGSLSTNTIGVSIGSATSSALFNGANLDVLTQNDAVTAGNAVATAINTVTSLLANVGALEERFNFASTAIQSAVQNQGAAKSALLDTDVAATSTAFATSQVQLQAGIAVLAQANQLQQNLLKLV